MFDLRPIELKTLVDEFGAVVEVVTFGHLLGLGHGFRELHRFAELAAQDEVAARFGRDVGCAGAVAVFAAVAGQQRRFFQALESARVRQELLWTPAGDVAAQAFGVGKAGRNGLGKAFGSVRPCFDLLQMS